MYISVMASVHNWVTIACEYHVTVWMPHVKFPFYIYIDIYYGLLVRVIHTLFVWVGSRKCYTQYIVFSSQYFPIFSLFFVYIFLYFYYIFEKIFLFFSYIFQFKSWKACVTWVCFFVSEQAPLTLFRMGGGQIDLPASFSLVTSTNIGISSQKVLTFCHTGVKFQGHT